MLSACLSACLSVCEAMKDNSQCEVAYWSALAVGIAAQLAVAHFSDFGCASQPHYGLRFTPQCVSGNDSLF